MLRALHGLGIYIHDGKRVIFERGGEFHSGEVFGSRTLTGTTPLEGMDEATRLSEIVEAADGLKIPPFKVEQKLREGKKVIYRSRRERIS